MKDEPREPKTNKKNGNAEKPISLRPLEFDEAVADLLKVKPEQKRGSETKRDHENEN